MTSCPSIELRPYQQQDYPRREHPGPFIDVSLLQNKSDLEVTFLIRDPDQLILWPDKVSSPSRKDNLWQQTCFELFIAHRAFRKTEAYQEWNFSSNKNWQAYAFENYRSPAPPQELNNATCPEIEYVESKLIVLLKDVLLGKDKGCFINPTAMIQLKDKTLIAYANEHPDKGPDFHSQECFLPLSDFSTNGDC